MRAFRCDKCGQYFDGEPIYEHRFISEGVYFSAQVVDKEYDLCWKCFVDLLLAGVSKLPLEDRERSEGEE